MIEKARNARSDIEWVQGDAAADLSHLGAFDLVFANASLQWLPDHRQLMPQLMRSVTSGGILAAQIPKFEEMPMAAAIRETSNLPPYSRFFAGFDPGVHLFEEAVYYEALRDLTRALDLWVTHYYHVLKDHPAIIDWMSSTGLRPFLDRLPEDCRQSFSAEVLERVKRAYPAQSDGKVFFIFKRFFFIAHKL